MSDRPRVALTMGDPAGVGPEVLIRTLNDPSATRGVAPLVVGSRSALAEWAERMFVDFPSCFEIVDVGDAPARPGLPSREGAAAALRSIETAARMCQSGDADAMVTAPVSKAEISSLGVVFRGHTEHLAAMTGARDFIMTFVHGRNSIGLATTHLPIAEVPGALSVEMLVSKLVTFDRGLRDWLGVDEPLIAVAALNPHAGEAGELGAEESTILTPAVAEAAGLGIHVEGPYPADALFAASRGAGGASGEGAFDAVLAMYHDQGTIPAKILGGGRGVNVTLGLPIVRTSVDHGTAFDLAGSDSADPGSMKAALALAAEIAVRRRG